MSRQNADSPFYKKITRRYDSSLPLSDDDIDRIRRTTNAIAALVSQQPELGAYLKVELVTGYDAHHLNFVTPIVRGQTLQSLIDSPDLSAHTRENLAERVDRLAPVLQRLAAHGFVHGDINAGNIMYEPTSGHMVLIDFEKAKQFIPEEGRGLKRQFDADMENLSHVVESMRRVPSRPRQPVSLQFEEQISSANLDPASADFDPASIEGYSDLESSEDDWESDLDNPTMKAPHTAMNRPGFRGGSTL
jgi:tRNA A-37 threonylcarbamoyl transferase component Bud32